MGKKGKTPQSGVDAALDAKTQKEKDNAEVQEQQADYANRVLQRYF